MDRRTLSSLIIATALVMAVGSTSSFAGEGGEGGEVTGGRYVVTGKDGSTTYIRPGKNRTKTSITRVERNGKLSSTTVRDRAQRKSHLKRVRKAHKQRKSNKFFRKTFKRIVKTAFVVL